MGAHGLGKRPPLNVETLVARKQHWDIPGSKGDKVAFTIKSSAFDPKQPIPARYTHDGENISPDLAWNDTPPGTETLALIVDDPDAPSGVFTHWVNINIRGTIDSLPAGVPHGDHPAHAGIQGQNDFGNIGYDGPQPPPGKPHHYRFTLYALETMLPLKPGATRQQVLDAMRGHVLGETQLIGTYENRAVGASR
jgi:Raf kinase inhibitor-like YbhB/YbcL family protein